MRSALSGALIYAIVGGLWILFSDQALSLLVADTKAYQELQTYKGWFYVVVTSLLLFMLLSRAVKKTQTLLQIDPLTYLPRHFQFSLALDKILKSLPHGSSLIMMDIDINNFSKINESKGHEFADKVLLTLANKLKNEFRDGALIGRLGADNFGIAVSHHEHSDSFDVYASRVFNALKRVSDKLDYPVQASIGIAIAPGDGKRSRELITRATAALQNLKGKGEGLFGYFSRELSTQLQRRQLIVHALRQPDCFSRFSLVYQPQYNALSKQVCGVEVLCRWHHPELGPVSPAEFIPVAEEIGVSGRISDWVIRQAYKELSDSDCLAVLPRVSVNISATEFNDELQLQALTRLFTHYSHFARYCQLEITETAALENPRANSQLLMALKALGLRFSIDDFGTGYTSLAMLQNLPIDEIKIDRAFVNSVEADTSTRRIVMSIIDIAANFGVNSVAEGVETDSQLKVLQETQCAEVQGYLLCHPLTIEQLKVRLKAERTQNAEVLSVNAPR
ncbi:hypothetical protein GCM10007391_29910 [Alteromonas halophila]|uniref:Bifunctional diguanylate cyclase/phosphodiesterase n=1 Tax=Alteromonas halophila TaxID=516698 RepID=A0A918N0E9_9ALTE|nr:hypothetical protein GCM10007391_29910 [Alteromonas halophila]